MRPWAVQLAQLFKERNNTAPADAAIATIISPLPDITVSLLDEILLDQDDLIIASRLYELDLQSGDQVILIPAANGQRYYMMDKVGN